MRYLNSTRRAMMMFFNRQSNKESELKIAKISGVVELNANVYADKLAEAISIVREDINPEIDVWKKSFTDCREKRINIDENISINVTLYCHSKDYMKFFMYFDIEIGNIFVCRYESSLKVNDKIYYKPWEIYRYVSKYNMPYEVIVVINKWANRKIAAYEFAAKEKKRISLETDNEEERKEREKLKEIFQQYKKG